MNRREFLAAVAALPFANRSIFAQDEQKGRVTFHSDKGYGLLQVRRYVPSEELACGYELEHGPLAKSVGEKEVTFDLPAGKYNVTVVQDDNGLMFDIPVTVKANTAKSVAVNNFPFKPKKFAYPDGKLLLTEPGYWTPVQGHDGSQFYISTPLSIADLKRRVESWFIDAYMNRPARPGINNPPEGNVQAKCEHEAQCRMPGMPGKKANGNDHPVESPCDLSLWYVDWDRRPSPVLLPRPNGDIWGDVAGRVREYGAEHLPVTQVRKGVFTDFINTTGSTFAECNLALLVEEMTKDLPGGQWTVRIPTSDELCLAMTGGSIDQPFFAYGLGETKKAIPSDWNRYVQTLETEGFPQLRPFDEFTLSPYGVPIYQVPELLVSDVPVNGDTFKTARFGKNGFEINERENPDYRHPTIGCAYVIVPKKNGQEKARGKSSREF